VREHVNRFEPVGFTLSVVSVKDIEAVSPGNLARQISELDCCD